MSDDPAGQGQKGDEGQKPAPSGSDGKPPQQPTPPKSEESGKQNAGNQPFDDLDKANKSYGEILRVAGERKERVTQLEQENERLKKPTRRDDDDDDGGQQPRGEDTRAVVREEMARSERLRRAQHLQEDTKRFFRNNPEVLKDAQVIGEMENIAKARPELLDLDDGMGIVHAMAERSIGRVRSAAADEEREKGERKERNNQGKSRTSGHSQTPAQRNYPSTDRKTPQEIRDMKPEERDAYAREHQFD